MDNSLFGNIRFVLLFAAGSLFSMLTIMVTVPTFTPFLLLLTYATTALPFPT